MGLEAESERYELAEQAFLQAIRERHDWPNLRSKAVQLAQAAADWGIAEHAEWRETSDGVCRNALAVTTDATELIAAIWRDVALAVDGQPPIGY